MKVKSFDAFTVRVAANGVVVSPIASPGEAIASIRDYVFTDMDSFIEHLRDKIEANRGDRRS